ncbi:MAG: hypothetical protein V3U33_07815 [candidate division NC10 bacterium]
MKSLRFRSKVFPRRSDSQAANYDDPVTPEAASVGRVATAPEDLELRVETLNRDLLHLTNFSQAY